MTEDIKGSGTMTGFFVGALVGAAVGAGVALLVAPRTGKEARKWLARSTREIKERAAIALEQAKESVRRETKGIAEEVGKKIANVQDPIR